MFFDINEYFWVISCNIRRQMVHLIVTVLMKHQAHPRSVSLLAIGLVSWKPSYACKYWEFCDFTKSLYSYCGDQDRTFVPDSMAFGGIIYTANWELSSWIGFLILSMPDFNCLFKQIYLAIELMFLHAFSGERVGKRDQKRKVHYVQFPVNFSPLGAFLW